MFDIARPACTARPLCSLHIPLLVCHAEDEDWKCNAVCSTHAFVVAEMPSLLGGMVDVCLAPDNANMAGMTMRCVADRCRAHTEKASADHIAAGGKEWDTIKPLHKWFKHLDRVLLMDDDDYKVSSDRMSDSSIA